MTKINIKKIILPWLEVDENWQPQTGQYNGVHYLVRKTCDECEWSCDKCLLLKNKKVYYQIDYDI